MSKKQSESFQAMPLTTQTLTVITWVSIQMQQCCHCCLNNRTLGRDTSKLEFWTRESSRELLEAAGRFQRWGPSLAALVFQCWNRTWDDSLPLWEASAEKKKESQAVRQEKGNLLEGNNRMTGPEGEPVSSLSDRVSLIPRQRNVLWRNGQLLACSCILCGHVAGGLESGGLVALRR